MWAHSLAINTHSRVLSRKIILGGKLVLRAVLVAPGGGCGRVCAPSHAKLGS